MSVANVMARIAELHQGLVPPSTAAATGGAQFASMLQDQATSSAGLAGTAGGAATLGFSGATG
ncbi:MAG: hypothetical protein JWR63_3547, partial [Conexibacter sp.]|nr:hypothetical protein [Conexibacter sp.]